MSSSMLRVAKTSILNQLVSVTCSFVTSLIYLFFVCEGVLGWLQFRVVPAGPSGEKNMCTCFVWATVITCLLYMYVCGFELSQLELGTQ